MISDRQVTWKSRCGLFTLTHNPTNVNGHWRCETGDAHFDEYNVIHYYKLGQVLLQIGAAITNWGKTYYKLEQVLQIRTIITNWGITNIFKWIMFILTSLYLKNIFTLKKILHISYATGGESRYWFATAKIWEKHLNQKEILRKIHAPLTKISFWDSFQFLLVQINHLVSP